MAATRFVKKTNPTNADLQHQIAETHECLHNVDEKVDRQSLQVAMLASAMGIKLPTDEELEAGAEPRKVTRRVGGLHPAQAAAILVPAVASGVGLYKFLEPAFIAFFVTLHHSLMR
jgi:hypothetical protein